MEALVCLENLQLTDTLNVVIASPLPPPHGLVDSLIVKRNKYGQRDSSNLWWCHVFVSNSCHETSTYLCCMSFASGLMQKTWKVQRHLIRIWSFYNNMISLQFSGRFAWVSSGSRKNLQFNFPPQNTLTELAVFIWLFDPCLGF